GCVPIVNENDAIASHELRYGDNDRIAALVAHNINADLLVLLTDTAGLFTADPRRDSTAELISEVVADSPLLTVTIGRGGSGRGSGGMASKFAAAKMASWSGTRAVIAAADQPDVLVHAAAGSLVGTTFQPSGRRLPARKLWIGFATQVDGVVNVDDGARRALVERGKSLLPAGVTDVSGDFGEGDVVEVRDGSNALVARGMVLSDATTLRQIIGKRTSDLPLDVAHEVIHRDDLVLLTEYS
ncbi:MAG TPA: glutamate 5-kinase, partial [Ilumatobacteraceae bacterium]|nr:glutamate 5-kinase [Ilumatobacteraceae bacterium]